MHAMDWQGVLSGQPLQWIISGFLTTLWVTLAGVVLATVFAIFLLSLRLTGQRFATTMVSVWVSVFRNTPCLLYTSSSTPRRSSIRLPITLLKKS